jgi:hypothetical protein
MEAYQSRVIDEKQELDSKLEKLDQFATSEQFATVAPAEQERLQRQLQIMKNYSQVLSERIEAFS